MFRRRLLCPNPTRMDIINILFLFYQNYFPPFYCKIKNNIRLSAFSFFSQLKCYNLRWLPVIFNLTSVFKYNVHYYYHSILICIYNRTCIGINVYIVSTCIYMYIYIFLHHFFNFQLCLIHISSLQNRKVLKNDPGLYFNIEKLH